MSVRSRDTVRSGTSSAFPERTVLDYQITSCFALLLFGVSRPYGFTNRTDGMAMLRRRVRTVFENRTDGMTLPSHRARTVVGAGTMVGQMARREGSA